MKLTDLAIPGFSGDSAASTLVQGSYSYYYNSMPAGRPSDHAGIITAAAAADVVLHGVNSILSSDADLRGVGDRRRSLPL